MLGTHFSKLCKFCDMSALLFNPRYLAWLLRIGDALTANANWLWPTEGVLLDSFFVVLKVPSSPHTDGIERLAYDAYDLVPFLPERRGRMPRGPAWGILSYFYLSRGFFFSLFPLGAVWYRESEGGRESSCY